jgi:hypothetical protein
MERRDTGRERWAAFSGQHHGNSIGVWSNSGGAGDTAMGAWPAAITLELWWERRDRRDGR